MGRRYSLCVSGALRIDGNHRSIGVRLSVRSATVLSAGMTAAAIVARSFTLVRCLLVQHRLLLLEAVTAKMPRERLEWKDLAGMEGAGLG